MKDTTDEARIDELYRRALSRPPVPEELAIALDHLQRKRSQAAASEDEEKKKSPVAVNRAAYEDMIWALLNTKEFLFNH